MPRTIIDAPLTTRAARERLAARHQPYWRGIGPATALGYRKGAHGGVWLVRVADADAGGGYRQATLGKADDVLKAAGTAVLDYYQAEGAARAWVAGHHRRKAGADPEAASSADVAYTVADAARDYLADYTARGGKGVPHTRAAIDAHVMPSLGDLIVSRLTRDRIRGWHRALAEAPARLRTGAGAKQKHRDMPADADAQRRRRSTANRLLTVLRAALNHAKAEGKVDCSADAWASVKPFRETDKPKVRYLLDDEATRLMNACSPGFRDLVSGALLTGARYGELSRITAGDFDPQAGTVTIAASKAGKPRHVFLTDEGRDLFARLATGRRSADRLFEREAVLSQGSKDAPAATRRAAWGKSDQFRLMRQACTAARITPAVSFHVLRHTYASRLATRGVPMPVIAAQLGHSDTRMTERHYAHLTPTYVAETIRAAFGKLGVSDSNKSVIPIRA